MRETRRYVPALYYASKMLFFYCVSVCIMYSRHIFFMHLYTYVMQLFYMRWLIKQNYIKPLESWSNRTLCLCVTFLKRNTSWVIWPFSSKETDMPHFKTIGIYKFPSISQTALSISTKPPWRILFNSFLYKMKLCKRPDTNITTKGKLF